MNRENLQKMADHIRTIPQELFSMRYYRSENGSTCDREGQKNTECNSVGCVIGHSLTLAPNLVTRDKARVIRFAEWSQKFTGIRAFGNEWDWLFSCTWSKADNSPEGAALRIEWLLNFGCPKTSRYQLLGIAPLCYIPQTKNPTSK
jgi:hypothetical protein